MWPSLIEERKSSLNSINLKRCIIFFSCHSKVRPGPEISFCLSIALSAHKVYLKAEQINKKTTIFTLNDHLFQTWPFWLKKVDLLSLEQQLFLSHLAGSWDKKGKNSDSIEAKSPVTRLMWIDSWCVVNQRVNPPLCRITVRRMAWLRTKISRCQSLPIW